MGGLISRSGLISQWPYNESRLYFTYFGPKFPKFINFIYEGISFFEGNALKEFQDRTISTESNISKPTDILIFTMEDCSYFRPRHDF